MNNFYPSKYSGGSQAYYCEQDPCRPVYYCYNTYNYFLNPKNSEMGCATGLVRFIVFVFNILCAIVGIALIAVASIAISSIKKYNAGDIKLSDYLVAPGLILGVGCVIFVIAFFGCCGAMKNSSCLLTTYAVILLVLFIVQLSIGIYAYVTLDGSDKTIKDEFKKQFSTAMSKYETDKSVKDGIDLIQAELHCCGSESWIEWGAKVPESCKCSSGADCTSGYYNKGCSTKLFETTENSLNIIGYVAMGICAVELVGSIFAFCLAAHSRR